jgi:hypothetical protein
VIGAPLTDLVWAGGRLLDAWPAQPDESRYARVRDSDVATLLIGGNLDFATPPQNATRELLPHLPNGKQVVLRNIGHADDFWVYQSAAADRLINTYLDTGRVDASLYTSNTIRFTPSVTLGTIAKIIVAVMLGFAALAALSLLLMWRRVHKLGRFGRKTSVVLRSVYTLVLGFGGWFAAVTVALVAFPNLPVDDALLGVLSIGLPVGLGIYWAWFDSTRSARARTIGFWAATGSALAGAWLGFHVIDGLFAVVTTIVGAAVGANLTLLVLDILGDRPAEEPVKAPQAILTPT